MRSPKLTSVIIPVFNDPDGLTSALEGLALQSWPLTCIEVIVVDNGSEEPVTLDVEYPFPVRVLRCETPGSYAARNIGVAASQGAVLAFTDADCIPCRHWLERGITLLMSGKGKWAVGGDVVFTHTDVLTAVAMYQIAMGFGQESNIRDKGFAATANLFCSRSQFETVGSFDERLLSGGDREWAWRANLHQIGMRLEPDAIVYTKPRRTLRGAVRQARRVVAGRARIRKLGLAHLGDGAVAKQQSSLQSLVRILLHQQLGFWDKTRVLNVAVLIRAAAALERIRLALGTPAERR